MTENPFKPTIVPTMPDEPSPEVRARLEELRAGRHVDDVTDLIETMFEIPAEEFFSRHSEAREVAYRAVAEQIANPTTTLRESNDFETAMDVLEAGYLRPGHPSTTPDEEQAGVQARAIAEDLTHQAMAPQTDAAPTPPEVERDVVGTQPPARGERPAACGGEHELAKRTVRGVTLQVKCDGSLNVFDGRRDERWATEPAGLRQFAPVPEIRVTVPSDRVDSQAASRAAQTYLSALGAEDFPAMADRARLAAGDGPEPQPEPDVEAKPEAETVKVYSSPHCQQCAATERSLKKAGVRFVKIDLGDLDGDQRAEVVAGHTQAPVVHAPDGQVWSGFRPDRIAGLTAGVVPTPQVEPGPGPVGPAR